MSSTSFAAASKKTSNRYARNEDDDGSIGRLAILPPDSPVFQTSIKGDDLAAKTLLSLSSPTSSINQNDELAAVLLGQLGYSDNDGTADDEDDGEMITYESDSSTVNGKLSRIDDIVVRAFMDLAQTTASENFASKLENENYDPLSLVASTAAGLAKMERRRSSAHAGTIRTPKFLQSPDDSMTDTLLYSHASTEDEVEFPDITYRVNQAGVHVDWSQVFKAVEETETQSEIDIEMSSSQPQTPIITESLTIPKSEPNTRQEVKQAASKQYQQNVFGVKKSSKYDMRLVRPYICVIGSCRKSYTKRRGLLSHGKSMHPEQIDLLKKVEPRLGGMQPAADEGDAPVWSEEEDNDSELADSDYGDKEATIVSKKRKRKDAGKPAEKMASSPIIVVSEVMDNNNSSELLNKSKKRNRRLSASDFTSDSGGEGMLTAEAAEELSLRIAFLNEQKPFPCTHKGCHKRYRNANGLKYHLEKGHLLGSTSSCEVPSGTSSTASLIQDTAGLKLNQNNSAQSLCEQVTDTHIYTSSAFAHTGSSSEDGNAIEAEPEESGSSSDHKPFVCPHLNCGKAYKNKNGLLYHLRKGKMSAHGTIDEK